MSELPEVFSDQTKNVNCNNICHLHSNASGSDIFQQGRNSQWFGVDFRGHFSLWTNNTKHIPRLNWINNSELETGVNKCRNNKKVWLKRVKKIEQKLVDWSQTNPSEDKKMKVLKFEIQFVSLNRWKSEFFYCQFDPTSVYKFFSSSLGHTSWPYF